MAKIKVVGEVVVVESDLTIDEIKKAERYRPDALKLKGENGETEFKVEAGESSISDWGAAFGGITRDGSDHAVITSAIRDKTLKGDELKDKLADEFGIALARLSKVEAKVAEVIAEVEETAAKVKEDIVIQ